MLLNRTTRMQEGKMHYRSPPLVNDYRNMHEEKEVNEEYVRPRNVEKVRNSQESELVYRNEWCVVEEHHKHRWVDERMTE